MPIESVCPLFLPMLQCGAMCAHLKLVVKRVEYDEKEKKPAKLNKFLESVENVSPKMKKFLDRVTEYPDAADIIANIL